MGGGFDPDLELLRSGCSRVVAHLLSYLQVLSSRFIASLFLAVQYLPVHFYCKRASTMAHSARRTGKQVFATNCALKEFRAGGRLLAPSVIFSGFYQFPARPLGDIVISFLNAR